MIVYKTKVIDIGIEAGIFREENIVILFGENSPSSLSDYCYNIKIEPVRKEIKEGMLLEVGLERYIITAVGAIVSKNLSNLGHVTIKFDGHSEAELPGTLHVENKTLPEINIETRISILV